MSTSDPHDDDALNAIEARLANWTPAAPGLSREHLLFEAGRVAGRRDRHAGAWRLTSLTLGLACLALLATRPDLDAPTSPVVTSAFPGPPAANPSAAQATTPPPIALPAHPAPPPPSSLASRDSASTYLVLSREFETLAVVSTPPSQPAASEVAIPPAVPLHPRGSTDLFDL